MNKPDTFCSRCGTAYLQVDSYPRECTCCAAVTWANPKPVAVVLMPVGGGVACIRRGIPPHVGKLALVGGFLVAGESWREGAVREVLEETGQRYLAEDIRVMAPEPDWDPLFSTPNDNLLQFMELPAIHPRDLVTGHVDHEIQGVEVVTEPVELAFPSHTEALRRFLEGRPWWDQSAGDLRSIGSFPAKDLLDKPIRVQQRMAQEHFKITLPLIVSPDGNGSLEVFLQNEWVVQNRGLLTKSI